MPSITEEREAERLRADRLARSLYHPAYPGYVNVVRRDQLAAHLALRPSKGKEKRAKRAALKAEGMSPSSSDESYSDDEGGYRKIKYKDFAQAVYKEERRKAKQAAKAEMEREDRAIDERSAQASLERITRLGLYQEREQAAEPRLLALASEEMYIRGYEPAAVAPALRDEARRRK